MGSERNTRIRASQIASILPDDIESTNAKVDNYIPSYDEATGKFTWVANAGGGISASEWNQNGFETKTTSTLTWTDSTPDRTLSIQPTDVSFDYWIAGVKYTATGDTVQITDVEGIHFIYYDGDTLTATANPSYATIISIIETKALVSIVYWNATDNEGIYIGEERHGKSMSPLTHSYLHFTEGLRYIDGLGLNTLSVDQDGDDNEDAQFGIDAGNVADEDLFSAISSITSTTGLPIYYMTGSTPIWNKNINTGYSVIKTGASAEDRLAYNQYTGGSWQLTEVSNADFVLCHIFATTEKDKPMIAIVGQAVYTTKRGARTGALTEIRELILNDILFPEIRPIATVIFQTRDSYANTMKARVVSTAEGDNYIDWREEVISRVSVSTTDHNSLTGKQGGTTDEYYHFNTSEHTELTEWLDNVTLGSDGTFKWTSPNGAILETEELFLGTGNGYAPMLKATNTVLSSAVALSGGAVVIYNGVDDPAFIVANDDLSLAEDISYSITNNRWEFSDAVKFENGVAVDEFSSDGTLAGDSDLAVPTEKAVKTYVDNINILPSTRMNDWDSTYLVNYLKAIHTKNKNIEFGVGTYAHGVTAVLGGYIGGVYSPTQNRIYLVPHSQAPETNWHYINEFSLAEISPSISANALFNKF